MDYESKGPPEVLTEVIEDLAKAEGTLSAARNKITGASLVGKPGYERIVGLIDSALASAAAALSEAHHELHES